MLLFAALGVLAAALAGLTGLAGASRPVLPFLCLYGLAWLAWLVALARVRRDPASLSGPVGVAGILLGATLLRAVAFAAPPVLESDWHRYLWDGAVLAAGLDPYRYSPREVQDGLADPLEPAPELAPYLVLAARPELAVHLHGLNHPEIPTCYPPLAELAFAALSRLAPGQLAPWKAFMASLDLVLCLVLVELLGRLGRPRAWVLFYAWCPLPLKEYANTGHFDPLATIFMLMALRALVDRRPLAGGIGLGLAAAAKLYPLVLLPALYGRLGVRGVAAALLTLGVVCAPFLAAGPGALAGLVTFARDWEFNSSLFALGAAACEAVVPRGPPLVLDLPGLAIPVTPDGFQLAKLVTGLALCLVLVALARLPGDEDLGVPGRALGALTGLYLLAPVADPWYLGWALPLVSVFPSAAFAWLAGASALYYLYFLEDCYLGGARLVEYGPFFLLGAWERLGSAAQEREGP